MKEGDIVRFELLIEAEIRNKLPEWKYGLLVEYHKWEKIATILYKDEVVRVAVRNVQKYGRGFQKQL